MKKYVFKPYSKIFPELFEKEKARIASHIEESLIIEHVGSTAIPGLGGKGIIDIAIAADEQALDAVSKQLQDLGYEFRPQYSTPDRLYFIIFLPDPEEGTRRYHLHLLRKESEEWKDLLHFRDHLRQHPEEAKKYGDLKKQAAEEVNEDGAKYRELKGPVFVKILKKRTRFTFKRAEPSERQLIHDWLAQDHIKEWLHGVGLKNTLENLDKSFEGETLFQHWIGYDNDTPFAYLLTSDEGPDAVTLDLFICDPNYLGKGLSVQMIREFLITHFSHKKEVLIDPEATNTRAIHVYEKVGFRKIGEFTASWHPVPHYQMRLYMKDLLDK